MNALFYTFDVPKGVLGRFATGAGTAFAKIPYRPIASAKV